MTPLVLVFICAFGVVTFGAIGITLTMAFGED